MVIWGTPALHLPTEFPLTLDSKCIIANRLVKEICLSNASVWQLLWKKVVWTKYFISLFQWIGLNSKSHWAAMSEFSSINAVMFHQQKTFLPGPWKVKRLTQDGHHFKVAQGCREARSLPEHVDQSPLCLGRSAVFSRRAEKPSCSVWKIRVGCPVQTDQVHSSGISKVRTLEEFWKEWIWKITHPVLKYLSWENKGFFGLCDIHFIV